MKNGCDGSQRGKRRQALNDRNEVFAGLRSKLGNRPRYFIYNWGGQRNAKRSSIREGCRLLFRGRLYCQKPESLGYGSGAPNVSMGMKRMLGFLRCFNCAEALALTEKNTSLCNSQHISDSYVLNRPHPTHSLRRHKTKATIKRPILRHSV